MFSIEVVDNAPSDGTPQGRIVAGQLDETFDLVVGNWTPADYESSWSSQLRLLVEGSEKALLLTTAGEPSRSHFWRGYALYRLNGEIRVQEHLIFPDEVDEPLNLAAPQRSVRPYEPVDEDGNQISTWTTTDSSVREFLDP